MSRQYSDLKKLRLQRFSLVHFVSYKSLILMYDGYFSFTVVYENTTLQALSFSQTSRYIVQYLLTKKQHTTLYAYLAHSQLLLSLQPESSI